MAWVRGWGVIIHWEVKEVIHWKTLDVLMVCVTLYPGERGAGGNEDVGENAGEEEGVRSE